MKPAKPRELPWSWERSPEQAWLSQFERMRRSRQRIIRSLSTGDLNEIFDLILAFFINCYHFRDWLLRSGKIAQADLDDLFRSAEDLRLCADMANIAKHFDLTDPRRRGLQLSIARESVGPGLGWFGDSDVLTVLSQGNYYDLLKLVTSCERRWIHFLTAKGLLKRAGRRSHNRRL